MPYVQLIMKSFALLFCFLGASALAWVQDPTYGLLWKPKEGQDFTYSIKVESSASDTKVEFGAELGMKVVKVEPNGDYTIESVFKHPTVTINGEEQKIDDEPEARSETEKYNARGERIDTDKDKPDDSESDPFGSAIADVMDFIAPEKAVKIGDKWTREIPGNDKKGKRPAKVEYKLEGAEKVGDANALKITFTYKETEGEKPVTSEGTYYLDADDGSLIKMDATIESAPMAEEGGTTKVTVARK